MDTGFLEVDVLVVTVFSSNVKLFSLVTHLINKVCKKVVLRVSPNSYHATSTCSLQYRLSDPISYNIALGVLTHSYKLIILWLPNATINLPSRKKSSTQDSSINHCSLLMNQNRGRPIPETSQFMNPFFQGFDPMYLVCR